MTKNAMAKKVKTLEIKFEEIVKQLKGTEKELEQISKKMDKNRLDHDKIRKPLEDQLNKLAKPFKKKYDNLENKQQKVDKLRETLENKTFALQAEIKNIKVLDKGKIESPEDFIYFMITTINKIEKQFVVIPDNYISTGRTVPEWDIRIKVKEDRYKRYNHGNRYNVKILHKLLNNDIRLIRLGDSGEDEKYRPFVKYFAFYGLKLVGYYYAINAEHRGDTTSYTSWIGKQLLRYDNTDRQGADSQYGGASLTYREWKRRLDEVKKPTILRTIDLTNKQNIITIISS